MATDPYKYFRVEAREISGALTHGLLLLEKAPSPERIAELLRLAHTLKGAARVVKEREVADLAHAIEDALGPLRDAGAPPAIGVVDAVLRLVDGVTTRLSALALPEPAEPPANLEAAPVATAELPTLRAELGEVDALLEGLGEVGATLATVRRSSAVLPRIHRLARALSDQLAALPSQGTGAQALRARLLAEELRVSLATAERDLGTGLEQTERELYQVQGAAERLRFVPGSAMMHVLERAVRDAAASLGKDVGFEARGGDVRLSADLLGEVQNALIHAVRNAVAHGIESPSERADLGKPSRGTVAVQVALHGRRVVFTCSDDGRGVDLEAVRASAAKKGLLGPEPRDVSPERLIDLLFEGGITTSRGIDQVAGRAIGLDVVREAAKRLNGTAALRSERGKGVSVTMDLPVSLSSLDALLVETSGQTAAIPLDAVRRTTRFAKADVTHTSEGERLLVSGVLLPFVRAARVLRHETADDAPEAGSAVIVQAGSAQVAVGVDRVVATESIVLRPLPKLAPADPIVGGAALDLEGNPRLVFDPLGLVAEAGRSGVVVAKTAPKRCAPFLVVDDSLTTRMLERSILEAAGYEVDLATSAEEGIEMAKRRTYGLFLVDVEMPGMDGFAFVRETRADPDLRSVPAILVTSRDAPEDRALGQAVGASAYIVKSEFEQNEFLSRIRKLVGSPWPS
ncbi:MAG TPA: response regulator [Polyangiaceae bacterium]|nr:response regulator [Polyangiaceae bacterium]